MKSFIIVFVFILMTNVHTTSSLADEVSEKKAYAEKLKALSEAQAGSIDFYGKVVDQSNGPVRGAVIKYRISPPIYSDWKRINDELMTDNNGEFNIKGKGRFLTISMPAHPELAEAYLPPLYENSHVRRELQFRPTDRQGEILADYTKRNPYIFNVWRTSKFEKVKAVDRLQRYGVTSNGEVFTLMDGRTLRGTKYKRFRSRTLAMVPGEHKSGLIKFTCERHDEAYAKRSGEWKVTLEPVDGGIKKTDDFYLYEAPRLQYSSSLTEKHTGKTLPSQKYYFRSKNQQIYGGLEVTYEPFVDKNACHILIKYQINENGSRNLAIKP